MVIIKHGKIQVKIEEGERWTELGAINIEEEIAKTTKRTVTYDKAEEGCDFDVLQIHSPRPSPKGRGGGGVDV